MISIVGNHTAFYKNTNDINTIDLMLREYDNIRIVEECEEITVGEESTNTVYTLDQPRE